MTEFIPTWQKKFKFTKLEHKIAKAIYEAKYPDSLWDGLHPNRNVRLCRLIEARAVVKVISK